LVHLVHSVHSVHAGIVAVGTTQMQATQMQAALSPGMMRAQTLRYVLLP
jgi:ABC-type amino acid transport system permease subunit